MTTQTQVLTRPLAVHRATTSIIQATSAQPRLSFDSEDLSTDLDSNEIPAEQLPGYTPCSVPRYTILAAESPSAIYVFRQTRRRERLISLVTEEDGELAGEDAYIIRGKRTPSLWRSIRKSPDLELTKIKSEDANAASSLYGGGSSDWRASTASLNLNNLFHSGSQAGSPWTSREPPAYSRVSPTRVNSFQMGSSLSHSQTYPRPSPTRSSSSTALLGHLYSTPPHPLRKPSLNCTPKLSFTYLRNPLAPKLVTIHAPHYTSFRLFITDAPKTSNVQDFQPSLNDQKYYAWKLTTYPSPAHSLMDRQGTCVARFVYGKNGTEARGWTEEMGRLEIYDASLPELDMERMEEFRGRRSNVELERGEASTSAIEQVNRARSVGSGSGSEEDEEPQKEDWTEVIIASCDLVVQYWRGLGRRYTNRPVKGLTLAERMASGSASMAAVGGRAMTAAGGMRGAQQAAALNRSRSSTPTQTLSPIHRHTVGASMTNQSAPAESATSPRGRASLSITRTQPQVETQTRSQSHTRTQSAVTSINNNSNSNNNRPSTSSSSVRPASRGMSLLETRMMVVRGYGGAPAGYARRATTVATARG